MHLLYKKSDLSNSNKTAKSWLSIQSTFGNAKKLSLPRKLPRFMTISYNWLNEYLPKTISPEALSAILTSIGLEVESLEKFEEIKGGLSGLVAGEVLTCEKHPEADKLKLTTVLIGEQQVLHIVCGAPNVAVGQKVIVATVGTTIYPTSGDPITLKRAKIRGVESEGMLCAEDEIGIGESHDGITILPSTTVPGTPIADVYQPYQDYIFEIGLTPNRMDAMSHLGVAKDVCAYLSYHEQNTTSVVSPFQTTSTAINGHQPFSVTIQHTDACKRYCGAYIEDVTIGESPIWLQQRLKSIGIKSINNVVDITNFILHETGQPLHAFDADTIQEKKIIVNTIAENTLFKTLDDKERKLASTDLMICDAMSPLCIAGVYGGLHSGVSNNTKNIFLESACFDKGYVRRTALKHDLRTDASTRFEKGVDISNTHLVLQRAAELIVASCGGKIVGEMIDVHPNPTEKVLVTFEYAYLTKLSGKSYPEKDVKTILTALGFEIKSENEAGLELAVPFSKSDIRIQADIVEEIMRIDGLDNVAIPTTISLSPSIEKNNRKFSLREKISNNLVGLGFNEIFTNSITNSAFYNEIELQTAVKMMNSLSVELDMLRPQMIQSGLQVIAHNLNRKNNHLKLYEFGKTYAVSPELQYTEKNHLAIYITGNWAENSWNEKATKSNFYDLKGIAENICQLTGLNNIKITPTTHDQLQLACVIEFGRTTIGYLGEASGKLLKSFDIKQPVFFADIDMDLVMAQKVKPIQFKEISKFPSVSRDLALVVDKKVSYAQIEQIALSNKIAQLKSIQLFDIFESEKLGADKKSMAVSFVFGDEQKTLTDVEIDANMHKIISAYEKTIQAEIRK